MPIVAVPKAEPAILGPFTFHINPDDFSLKSRAVENVVRTKSGFVRQYWGQDPDTYILRGSTGKAGLEEIMRLRAVEGMSNISFIFPFKGIRTTVRVTEVSYTNTVQSPYVHNYGITLVQDFAKTGPSFLPASTQFGVTRSPTVETTGIGTEMVARSGENIYQMMSRYLPPGVSMGELQNIWNRAKVLNPYIKDWTNLPEGTVIKF